MNTVVLRDGTKYNDVFQIDDNGDDNRTILYLVDGEEQSVTVPVATIQSVYKS